MKSRIRVTERIRRLPTIMSSFVYLLVFLVATNPHSGVSCFAVGTSSPRLPLDNKKKSGRRQSNQPVARRPSCLHATLPALPGEADEETDTPMQYLRGGGDTLASKVTRWPCFDALDKQLIKIAVPCILNFAIAPLVGAVDLFWVNQMGNPLAVAGQAAANQVFNSVFWLAAFLPSGAY